MKCAAIDFCKRLGIEFFEGMVPFYEKGLKMKEKLGGAIADKERLIRLNDEYNFLRKWHEDIYKAADIIKEDDDLLLYNYILACIIKEKADASLLPPPDKGVIETDFSPLFGLLWFAEDMIEEMKKRGLPQSVISDTMQCFDAEINDYYDMVGRSGMRVYVGWFLLFVYGKIIRVGRLNFEFTTLKNSIKVYKKGGDIKILVDGQDMHKKGMVFGSGGQDDEEGKFFAGIEENGDTVTGYTANEFGECIPEKITLEGYECIAKKGDEMVGIHIPAHESFDVEVCKKSIRDFTAILKKCYPEKNIKIYHCGSWMLCKKLKGIMGRETNITKFADLFINYPSKSAGEGVYSFLFHLPSPIDPKDLPENSSMQRAVKKYLMEGNYFFEGCGIIEAAEYESQ